MIKESEVTPVIISEYSDMHSFKDAVANFGRDRFLFYNVEKFSDVDRKGGSLLLLIDAGSYGTCCLHSR